MVKDTGEVIRSYLFPLGLLAGLLLSNFLNATGLFKEWLDTDELEVRVVDLVSPREREGREGLESEGLHHETILQDENDPRISGAAARGFEQGQRALRRADYRKALALFEEARTLDSLNPVLISQIGMAAMNLGDTARARTLLTEAVNLDQSFARGYFNLGFFRMQHGDRAGARKALERAILLQPNYDIAYYNLGVLELRDENLDKARSHFLRAL